MNFVLPALGQNSRRREVARLARSCLYVREAGRTVRTCSREEAWGKKWEIPRGPLSNVSLTLGLLESFCALPASLGGVRVGIA